LEEYSTIYIYKTRLASNEIFSPSNKIHREVGRANLSASLYQLHYRGCLYTVCPTRYRTRLAGGPLLRVATIRRTTDTFLFISHTTNVLLFKFRCNIYIGVRIIKEMPGSVASGTHCVSLQSHLREQASSDFSLPLCIKQYT